jgi:putative peptidoglycan lipid II flippase
MLPLTAALFVMGDTSVNLLYGRGDFSSQAVIQTTYCLWAYGIGLIPSALVLILAPASYAQSNYALPATASFVTMLLNLLLNTLFIVGFKWGAMSVALATSISAWVNVFLVGWSLAKRGTCLISWDFLQQAIPTSISTVFALWGTYQIRILFQQVPLFSDFLFSSSFYMQCLTLAYQVFTFSALFLISYLLIVLIHQVSSPSTSKFKLKG